MTTGIAQGRPPLLAIALLGLAALGAACSAPRSYLDPSPATISYADLRRPEAAQPLALSTAFQRNGQAFSGGDANLRGVTERVLQDSGIIAPVLSGADGQISVVVNNVSRGDGIGRDGNTTRFGLAGRTVADHYVMDVTIRSGVADESSATPSSSRPRYFASSSSADVPTGLDLMSSRTAFDRIVEQMLLQILREYQDSGDAAQR